MQRQRKIFWGKAAAILGVVPLLLWGYEYGPDPGYAGVPHELGNCTTTGGCHVGTVNTSGGSVSVAFPTGSSYTPGVKQHLTVTIADPAASQQAWGFQLTARLVTDTTQMAGSFASTDANTTIICSSASLQSFLEVDYSPAKAQTCAATMPLQYMEHSLRGYQTSVGQRPSASYSFDWTPPATNAGNVTIYVTGNAGPGGPPTQNNAHIYTATYTLTPAAATTPPVLRANNPVQDAINNRTQIVPGSWVAVYGTNFADVPASGKDWSDQATNGHFPNGALPTQVANVQVLVNDVPAPVWYVFPGQVNFQAPTNISGTATVKVQHNDAVSSPATVTVAPVSPGVISYSADFQTYYHSAQFAGTTNIVGDPAVFGSGVKKAKPGDAIVIYVTGLASTQSGVEINNPITFTPAVTVSIGSNTLTPLAVTQIGPGYWALGFQVPSGLAAGNYPFKITTNNQDSQTSVVFVVGP